MSGCRDLFVTGPGPDAGGRLARDGLATIQPGTMRAGTRQITVVWVAITEAGQRALADDLGRPVG